MKKLDGKTADILSENIEKIKQLFPEVFIEGKIDFDMFQKILRENVETERERYGFTWHGKSDAIKMALKQTTGTLRPKKADSKHWDTTRNLFIEGDNLEVLRALQESYRGKIKMIYIDPPYNTGREFVYDDNFNDNIKNYKEKVSSTMQANADSSGRYHTNWLNMMYPRLRLAKNLLMDDGVILISIDDNEVHNLRKVCDEIFGEENFVESISRLMKSGGNKGQFFSPNIEYILVYSRNVSLLQPFRLPLEQEFIDRIYTRVENVGGRKGERYREMGLYQAGLDTRPNQRYWIKCPDGSFVLPPGRSIPPKLDTGSAIIPKNGDGVWRWIFERFSSELQSGNIIFKKTKTSSLVDEKGNKSKWNIYTKIWLKDRLEEGRVPTDFIAKYENRLSSAELKELDIPFEFAKPSKLIKYLISLIKMDDEIILDFFAGSATTAHAIMQFNVEDGGNRKFIMVQIPELTPEDSEARKAGYNNIAEIAKERIRRIGEKIISDINTTQTDQTNLLDSENETVNQKKLDIGFKVFELDETNFKLWDPNTKDIERSLLDQLSPLKEERTDEDAVYEILLKYGIDLTTPVTELNLAGKKVFSLADGYLLICLEKKIELNTVKEMAKLSPKRVVFYDDGFLDDTVKANAEQTLKKAGAEEIMVI